MDRQVTHPSKEQVRAYMEAREHARQPPPAPEEIRRQLGWRLAPEPTCSLYGLYFFPSALGQLAAQSLVNLCLMPWWAYPPAGKPWH
ncbi:MAG: hypothetical protein ACXU8N_20190 [Telluria sp.]